MGKVADRVMVSTTTTGTGTYTLGSAFTGYRTFSQAVTDGDITDGGLVEYCATDGTDWEVYEGVYTVSGTTLTRGTLRRSSTGSAINWGAGSKTVFITMPAEGLPVYGTWTPSLGGDTTYYKQEGKYTKVGRQVSFEAYIETNLLGTGSTVNVSGLPFSAVSGYGPVVSVMPIDVATNIVMVAGRISGTTISIDSKTSASSGFASNAIFKDNAFVYLSGTYFTA